MSKSKLQHQINQVKRCLELLKKSEDSYTLHHSKEMPQHSELPDSNIEHKESKHAESVTIHNKQNQAVGHLTYVNHPDKEHIYPLQFSVGKKHENKGLIHRMIQHAEAKTKKPMKSSSGKHPFHHDVKKSDLSELFAKCLILKEKIKKII